MRRALAMPLVAVAILVGCGGGDDDEASSDRDPAEVVDTIYTEEEIRTLCDAREAATALAVEDPLTLTRFEAEYQQAFPAELPVPAQEAYDELLSRC